MNKEQTTTGPRANRDAIMLPHCCECAMAEDAVALSQMFGDVENPLTDGQLEVRARAISFLKRRFDNALLPKAP